MWVSGPFLGTKNTGGWAQTFPRSSSMLYALNYMGPKKKRIDKWGLIMIHNCILICICCLPLNLKYFKVCEVNLWSLQHQPHKWGMTKILLVHSEMQYLQSRWSTVRQQRAFEQRPRLRPKCRVVSQKVVELILLFDKKYKKHKKKLKVASSNP